VPAAVQSSRSIGLETKLRPQIPSPTACSTRCTPPLGLLLSRARGSSAASWRSVRAVEEESSDLCHAASSYAGGDGWGPVMPSSYRNYGKDGDGDGKRDLIARRATPSPRSPTTSSATAGRAARRPSCRAVAAPARSPSCRRFRGEILARRPRRQGLPPGRRERARPAGDAADAGRRERSEVLDRLPELLRDHPLQPLADVRDGGAPAGAGHRRALRPAP
jgi:hypothetical protein